MHINTNRTVQKLKSLKITKNISLFSLSFFIFFLLPITEAAFVDVDVTHPYFHAIDALEEQNIIQGHKQGDIKYFRPIQEINRAEALKILLMGSGPRLEESANNKFPDVKRTAWFHSIVHTASDKNIV